MLSSAEIFERANAIHGQWTKIAAAAYRELHPEAGECRWQDGQASAVMAGDGNPLTQCYGLGTDGGSPKERIDAVIAFFEGRTSKWELILTPFEAVETWNLAVERGLRFDHFENLLYLSPDSLGPAPELPPEMAIVTVSEGQVSNWADLSMRAFSGGELPPFAEDLKAVLRKAKNSTKYWGLWEGEPVAASSSSNYDGAVFLGGMGTLEPYRKRGFQQAMLDRRVRDSMGRAEIAMVEALPGSSSHRNIERLGFRVAYTTAVLVYESSEGR